MAYVAGKAIEVMRGGETVKLKPGDPVPEAATWRNLKKELAWKRVVEVPDGQAKAAEKAAPAPVPIDDETSKPKRRGRKLKEEKPPWEE